MSDNDSACAPWERQPGESARAFGAFCIFRDLGPRRSLRECCRRFYGDGTTSNLRQISTWASKFQWVERCRGWDDHLDEIGREEQARQRKEMVERHARVAQAALDKAADAIDKIAPADMKAGDVIKWLVEAAKLERVSRGEPETIQEQRSESHVHIDVFERVEQYAAVLKARREQRGLLESAVRSDGVGESVDQASANGQTS